MLLADYDVFRVQTEEVLKAELVRTRAYVGATPADEDRASPRGLADRSERRRSP